MVSQLSGYEVDPTFAKDDEPTLVFMRISEHQIVIRAFDRRNILPIGRPPSSRRIDSGVLRKQPLQDSGSEIHGDVVAVRRQRCQGPSNSKCADDAWKRGPADNSQTHDQGYVRPLP